jgi:hypothetical protein
MINVLDMQFITNGDDGTPLEVELEKTVTCPDGYSITGGHIFVEHSNGDMKRFSFRVEIVVTEEDAPPEYVLRVLEDVE